MRTFAISLLFLSIVVAAPFSASAATNPGVKPGSFFYFFDTAFERVNLFFTFNPEKKARKALEYADERLAEAETLTESKDSSMVKAVMENYTANIVLAAEKSKEVKDQQASENLFSTIADNTSKNQEVLSSVLVKVPEEAKDAILKAIEASKKEQEEATKQIAQLKGEVEQLKQEVAELKKEPNNLQVNEVERLKKEVEEPKKKQGTAQSTPKQPTPTTTGNTLEIQRISDEQKRQEGIRRDAEEAARKLIAENLQKEQEEAKIKAEQERLREVQKLADQRAAEERQKELERQQQLENQRLVEEKGKAEEVSTKVQGVISQNTVWTLENSPYIVVGNLKIEEGVTLEIKPGVVIRFDGGYYLMVSGELKSRGTSQNFVTFTSNKTNPRPGDWETIEFIDSAVPSIFNEDGSYASGSIIQFTKIEYAKTGITYKGGDGLLIDNNIIQNNGVNSSGGGIYLANISWSKITNNTIRNNSAGSGGGLYLSPFRGEVVNNVVSNNSAMTFSGGGIYAEIHRGKIENNIINDNKGKLGGGGLAIHNSWVAETTYPQIVITGNLIKNNLAGVGGGIYLGESRLNLSSNTVENNTAARGGGIAYLNLDGQITNNIIQNNISNSSGGGISGGNWSSYYTKTVISHNIISANTAGINDWGGGIGISDGSMIMNNVIKQNKALSGKGGSIFIYEKGNPKINNNILVENGDINEIYNSTANDIDVSNNWWGTTDTSIIDSKIYDYSDDFKKGEVIYTPFATSEFAEAGVQ